MINPFIKSDFYGTVGYKTNSEIAKERNIFFDTRSKVELYYDLEKEKKYKNLSFVIGTHMVNEYTKKMPLDNIMPVSNGQGNTKSIYCNENGKFDFLDLDMFGFPNSNSVYTNIKNFDLVILGDSFAKGCGVSSSNKTSNLLSDKYGYKVLNLANGGALLSEIAAYREIGKNYSSKYVILNFYEGNDFNDLQYELKTYLKNYEDINFYQSLETKTKEVDLIYKDIVKKELDKASLKTNSKLKLFKSLSLDNIFILYNRVLYLHKEDKLNNENSIDFEKLKDLLKVLKHDVELNHSKLIINLIPTWSRYHLNYNEDVNYRYSEKFFNILREIDIYYIDLNKYINSNYKNPKILYRFGRHNHFNELGYSIMAEHINNEIKKLRKK